MADLEDLLSAVCTNTVGAVLNAIVLLLVARALYCIFLHPIAHIPGPVLAKFTSLWLYYHAYIGDEASVIYALHRTYGPLLRVSPNQVDVGDADAVQPIYIVGGGFLKADCYANFDIDAHKTIFSTTDPAYRARRAKAVLPLFSTASLRGNCSAIYDCVDRMVARMQSEASTGRPVNVLNLTRSLAVDVVSTHLFQLNYNGTEEKTERLSVSAFVDAFVAVGRFFYVPTWAFPWIEWAFEKVMPSEQTKKSMEIVDYFVNKLVARTAKGSLNYPGRLMDLNLEMTEIGSQCKDLIFAGTDSTGMNLAMICRYMALNPEKYKTLRDEIVGNKMREISAEIQALPYMNATIKEALRLSMANPTRLPRAVPSSGWDFKGTHFPPGTTVGCSAFELHLDPAVFHEPDRFVPERWLGDDPEAKARMNKSWFAFGAGGRACIARNLAMMELYMATERLVESGVLDGAWVCQEQVEIYEWFNSSVKGAKIELVWPTRKADGG